MRILSQNGLHEGIIDVPYEQVSLEQKKNEIWCGYSSALDRNCVGKCFAKYSTEAKARKAMEMLRDAYSPKIEIKEPIEKEIPKPKASDWVWTVTEPRVEVLDNFYFQFSQDSEVEV